MKLVSEQLKDFKDLQDKQFEEHCMFLAHLERLNKRQKYFKELQDKQFEDHRKLLARIDDLTGIVDMDHATV